VSAIRGGRGSKHSVKGQYHQRERELERRLLQPGLLERERVSGASGAAPRATSGRAMVVGDDM
jgi:hypothetical protein